MKNLELREKRLKLKASLLKYEMYKEDPVRNYCFMLNSREIPLHGLSSKRINSIIDGTASRPDCTNMRNALRTELWFRSFPYRSIMDSLQKVETLLKTSL